MEKLLKILAEEEWDVDAPGETQDHFIADIFEDKFEAYRYGYNQALKKVRERLEELD